MLFPNIQDKTTRSSIILDEAKAGDLLPSVAAVLAVTSPGAFEKVIFPEALSRNSASPSLRLPRLLNEESYGSLSRPNIRGHRIMPGNHQDSDGGMARDWSPRFILDADIEADDTSMSIRASDADAGLSLLTQIESMPGGSLRLRHTLENTAEGVYELEALEVRIPLSDRQTEILDFTGRHEHERIPQRHGIGDGTWLREHRRGKPGYEGNMLIAGTPGFGFADGDVIAVQPAWSGNAVLAVDRSSEDLASISAGELLLPGEMMLAQGERYETPWIIVTASDHGLDGVAQSLHNWQRSLPLHPQRQAVTLNVWEAVYFDHDFGKLADIARKASEIGVERYVLDDGWFHSRRDDLAGLGDWWVDPEVWPQGLKPLIDLVHGYGMQFGLWFEPEMVNPDSDLYRQHPEWIMKASGRQPMLHRHQFVLDLSNPEAYGHVFEHMSRVLEENPVDYVKWDHNRDLLEGGSPRAGYSPAVHNQTLAYWRLLEELHQRFPNIEWESCASGGGRIDMGVIERVSRFWSSDMTDALSRQRIQEWLVQNVAPEYLGAHISAPTSHQSGRTFSLAFRAATAVFYGFGIEWNLREASEEDLEELTRWIAWYKEHRPVLHGGDHVRIDVADPAVIAYGSVAKDGASALIAHVQYEESDSNRGVWLRIPGLDPEGVFELKWSGPEEATAALETLDPSGPSHGSRASGAFLSRIGIWIPRCRPQTVRLIEIQRR
ncbi:MAG: alpha-galactosidase [Bifidobacterium psychraerophilum]|uniref:alpha-galactosidase n=1 Tax=Bifidobacterium psychraerophilum TaxID=218140 RepID=UPI0039EB522F